MSLLDPQADYAADVVREVRGRHSGETHTVRIARRDLEEDDYQDANLFDEDYTIAATTGFSVWEGAHLMLDLMLGKPRVDGANDCGSRGGDLAGGAGADGAARDERAYEYVLRGARVLELGSGTGFAGLCLAAAGARVLLTDLTAVVEQSIAPNVKCNATAAAGDGQSGDRGGGENGGWAGELRVGDGSAAWTTLDWTKPVHADPHTGADPRRADVVVAAEALWLRELVEPFVSTVASLLSPRGAASHCLLAFRDRAGEASQCFANKAVVLDALDAAGCGVEELSSAPSIEEPGRSVVLMRIASKGAWGRAVSG